MTTPPKSRLLSLELIEQFITDELTRCSTVMSADDGPDEYGCGRYDLLIAMREKFNSGTFDAPSGLAQAWVAVSERLPDDRIHGWREVIIACAGGFVTYADYWCEEQKFWKDKGEYCEREYYDVTHWMPLPQPPEPK